MKLVIFKAGERHDVEAQFVPRVGEVLTVEGLCRGSVKGIEHRINPRTGEHTGIVFLSS